MKTVVIYQSKTGFTKKYAEWIRDALEADIFEHKQVNKETLIKYDVIIYGGSLHAIGINGIHLIKKNFADLASKKLIIFATGASPKKKNIEQEIGEDNFTKEELKSIHLFYLRGGFHFQKLPIVDKFLMTLLKWKMVLKPKSKRTNDEIGMLAVYKTPVDYTKKADIYPIIELAKQ